MNRHRNFYKRKRDEARSREPSHPGQPGSYEEALRVWEQVNFIGRLLYVRHIHGQTHEWLSLRARHQET